MRRFLAVAAACLAVGPIPAVSWAAFPQVQSLTATDIASGTSLVANLPATVTADDLLLLLIGGQLSVDGVTFAAPDGWTEIATVLQTTGTDVRLSVFAKVADGTEDGGTATVTASSATTSGAHVYRITGWDGALAGVTATTATGSGTANPDPPSHTSGFGAEDTLWIPVLATYTTLTISGYPSSYTDGASINGELGSARRELNTATENPATFTMDTSGRTCLATIAVRTGTAGGGGGGGGSAPACYYYRTLQTRSRRTDRGPGYEKFLAAIGLASNQDWSLSP